MSPRFWIAILVLSAACSGPTSVRLPGTPAATPTPLLVATSTPTPPWSPRYSLVILISIDGLRPDALLQAQTTHLDGLWKSGASSWSAQTVLPSVSLPAHASMLSGQPPEIHGILWNDWEPERGYIAVPTALSLANREGLEVGFIVAKPKLEHLAPPGSVDDFRVPGSDADTVVEEAIDYLVQAQPNLLVIHFADVDEAGHRSGWMSSAQMEAVRRVDAAIGRLLQVVAQDRALVIVTADHGGHFFGHGTDNPEDMTIPWIAAGPGVRREYVIRGPASIMDTAATVLFALGLPVPEQWTGRPLVEIFEPVEAALSQPRRDYVEAIQARALTAGPAPLASPTGAC